MFSELRRAAGFSFDLYKMGKECNLKEKSILQGAHFCKCVVL